LLGNIGAITGVASQFLPKGGGGAAPPRNGGFGGSVQGTGSVTLPGVGTVSVGGGTGITIRPPGTPVNGGFGPGFAQFGGVTSGSSTSAPGACVPGMPGVRLNKTGYHLRDGTFIAPGTKCVRSRRRNPLNPRALSKALSRVTSFKKAATVASRITIRSAGCARCK
jgi:hypothetical protein